MNTSREYIYWPQSFNFRLKAKSRILHPSLMYLRHLQIIRMM